MSGQKFIRRNQKPRVHIEYEVETGGATEKVSLPWVMGVMADLSGHTGPDEIGKVEDRDFVEISPDNFDSVMKKNKPSLTMDVPDRISGEEGKSMKVKLSFNKMEDFSPASIARRDPTLKKLLDARTKLQAFLSYAEDSDEAQALISKVLQDEDLMKAIAGEQGGAGGAAVSAGEAPPAEPSGGDAPSDAGDAPKQEGETNE